MKAEDYPTTLSPEAGPESSQEAQLYILMCVWVCESVIVVDHRSGLARLLSLIVHPKNPPLGSEGTQVGEEYAKEGGYGNRRE